MNAIETLKEQQARAKKWSTVYMVAEQLMDICRAEPDSAEIIAQDLENEKMSIVEAEKRVKAIADAHQKDGHLQCVGVNPMEAEDALREFYGLRKRGEAPAQPEKTLNFLDFMR